MFFSNLFFFHSDAFYARQGGQIFMLFPNLFFCHSDGLGEEAGEGTAEGKRADDDHRRGGEEEEKEESGKEEEK